MFRRVVRGAALAVTAVGLAAVCNAALPGPAVADQLPPPHLRSAREARVAAAVVRLLNAERSAAGLQPLHVRAALQRSARAHDVAMSRADVMSHRLPGEPVFTARIRAVGYDWQYAGENIAWNSATTRAGALQLERVMFRERPPNDEHRDNILGGHFRDVGVDLYLDARHHRLWLTTDFAAR